MFRVFPLMSVSRCYEQLDSHALKRRGSLFDSIEFGAELPLVPVKILDAVESKPFRHYSLSFAIPLKRRSNNTYLTFFLENVGAAFKYPLLQTRNVAFMVQIP